MKKTDPERVESMAREKRETEERNPMKKETYSDRVLKIALYDPEPPPKSNDSRPIWELVVEDMKERDQVGRKKYRTPLQAGNGRNPLVDAYQEARLVLPAPSHRRKEYTMKTQGVSQRPQQPPQVATQRPNLPDEREVPRIYTDPTEDRIRIRRNFDIAMRKHYEEEAMDLIALTHMSVEEAATVLLQKPLVSAEEFRTFWDRAESSNREARKEVSDMEIQMESAENAREDAELETRDLWQRLEDEEKKTAALERDLERDLQAAERSVRDLRAELEDR